MTRQVTRGTNTTEIPTFRVHLTGGRASGQLVGLTRLLPRVAIYENGTGPVALEPSAAPPQDYQVWLGDYQLVEPAGPETPVYVAVP